MLFYLDAHRSTHVIGAYGSKTVALNVNIVTI